MAKAKEVNKPKRGIKQIKFEVKLSGAPYPAECWWRIRSSNGQLYVHSENMGKRNAWRVIKYIINAVQAGRFILVETDTNGKRTLK